MKKLIFTISILGGILAGFINPVLADSYSTEPIQNNSYNWSGYVASSSNYTAVSGTWTVPRITTDSSILSADATWVGIGGVFDTDLIQAGTMYTRGVYQAWYEILPDPVIPVSLKVRPEDSITTSLNQTSTGNWDIRIQNNTNGETYETNLEYASTNSSAEWVEEMPSSNFGPIPLDDFGTIDFSDTSTLADGVTLSASEAGAQMMSMMNFYGEVLAQPTAMNDDGKSFSVVRTSATAIRPQPRIRSSFRRLGFGFGQGPGSDTFQFPGSSGKSFFEIFK